MTLEVYYRFHLTEHLAITPDFQWIINPNVNSLTYWGIRARATLWLLKYVLDVKNSFESGSVYGITAVIFFE